MTNTNDNSALAVLPEPSRIVGINPASLDSILTMHLDQRREGVAKAQKQLQQIQDSNNKLSRSMQKQAARAKKLTQHLRDIKEADGIRGKVSQLSMALVTYAQRLPGASLLYNALGAEAPPIHVSLEMQIATANDIKTRLYGFIHGEDGTRKTIENLANDGIRIIQSAHEVYKRLMELTPQHADAETDYQSLVKDFESKHGKVDKLNPAEMNPETSGLYSKIVEAKAETLKKSSEIEALKDNVINLFAHYKGVGVLIQNTQLLHDLGRNVHSRIDQFLSDAGPNVTYVSSLLQIEQLMVEGCRQSQDLQHNLNEIVKRSSEHLKQLAQNVGSLVPETVFDIETLQLSAANNREARAALQDYSNRRGKLALEFADQIKYLPVDTKGSQS